MIWGILGCAVSLLFLTTLFPPWRLCLREGGTVRRLDYDRAFLFTLPTPATQNITLEIDFGRLLLDWVILLAVTVFALARAYRWLSRRPVAPTGAPGPLEFVDLPNHADRPLSETPPAAENPRSSGVGTH